MLLIRTKGQGDRGTCPLVPPNLELQQFLSEGMTGSGRLIDTEDYKTTVLNDFNTEVLVFAHKSGLITLEWDDGDVLYILSGSIGLDKMLEIVHELQLFKN